MSIIFDDGHKARCEQGIVHLARAVLAGQLGLVEASPSICRLGFELELKDDDDIDFFIGISSETDHLPIGAERKSWNPDALRVKDDAIGRFEEAIKPRAMSVCNNLILRFGTENEDANQITVN